MQEALQQTDASYPDEALLARAVALSKVETSESFTEINREEFEGDEITVESIMLQTDSVTATSGETQTEYKVKTESTQIYATRTGNVSTQAYPMSREHLSQTSILDLKDCCTQYDDDLNVVEKRLEIVKRENLPDLTENEKNLISLEKLSTRRRSSTDGDDPPLSPLEVQTEAILKTLESVSTGIFCF
jgi:hypothetical protein